MPGGCVNHEVRSLTVADIPSAVVLSTIAGWNQTAADWNRLLQFDQESCLAIECQGVVVATATITCYQDQLAWLGMVLTHPNYRNRGFGRRLVEAALKVAERRNIPSVKLDATEQGLALYRNLGFREEQEIERWSGPGRHSSAPKVRSQLTQSHLDLDIQAFGANRSHVLNSFDETAFIAEDGFAFWRPGARFSHFGPCVSNSANSAKQLCESCLSTNEGQWCWDLLPANPSAVQIARDLDFTPVRKLIRMAIGPEVKGCGSMIYAGGGFELG